MGGYLSRDQIDPNLGLPQNSPPYPYNNNTILITGPQNSGKTTLWKQLLDLYNHNTSLEFQYLNSMLLLNEMKRNVFMSMYNMVQNVHRYGHGVDVDCQDAYDYFINDEYLDKDFDLKIYNYENNNNDKKNCKNDDFVITSLELKYIKQLWNDDTIQYIWNNYRTNIIINDNDDELFNNIDTFALKTRATTTQGYQLEKSSLVSMAKKTTCSLWNMLPSLSTPTTPSSPALSSSLNLSGCNNDDDVTNNTSDVNNDTYIVTYNDWLITHTHNVGRRDLGISINHTNTSNNNNQDGIINNNGTNNNTNINDKNTTDINDTANNDYYWLVDSGGYNTHASRQNNIGTALYAMTNILIIVLSVSDFDNYININDSNYNDLGYYYKKNKNDTNCNRNDGNFFDHFNKNNFDTTFHNNNNNNNNSNNAKSTNTTHYTRSQWDESLLALRYYLNLPSTVLLPNTKIYIVLNKTSILQEKLQKNILYKNYVRNYTGKSNRYGDVIKWIQNYITKEIIPTQRKQYCQCICVDAINVTHCEEFGAKLFYQQ